MRRSPILWSALAALLLAIGLLASPLAPIALAQEEEAEKVERSLSVDSWLHVRATPLALPAFHDEEGAKELAVKDLLEQSQVDLSRLWPDDGDEITLAPGQRERWRRASDEDISLAKGEATGPSMALAAFYISTDRFVELALKVSSPHLMQVYVDGEKKEDKTEADAVPGEDDAEGQSSEDDEDTEVPEVGSAKLDLQLETGKHVVIIKALRDPEGPAEWTLAAELTMEEENAEAHVVVDDRSTRALRLADLLDAHGMGALDLSPDGSMISFRLRSPAVPSDNRESWREIRNADDGSLVRSFRGMGDLGSFAWRPGTKEPQYSFVTRDDGKASLWVSALDGDPAVRMLEGIEHFESYLWMPDGSGVVYSVGIEAEEKNENFKRYQHLADRWSSYRDKSYLHLAAYPSGVSRRLTGGVESTGLQDIAPDGSALLFGRSLHDRGERPFSMDEIYELDLSTLELRRIVESAWVGGADYSPDGKTILLTGGPSAFGDLGINLPQGRIPNDYDSQLYLIDRKSLEVDAIARDFDPSLGSAFWSRKDGNIYLSATDGSWVRLYRYDVKKKHFDELATDVDVLRNLTISEDGTRVAYTGSSADAPTRLFTQKTKGNSDAKLAAFPDAERFADVKVGEVDDWSFVASDGTSILGRIHYPPNFDDAKSYPLIVYYYGGTSPVTRDFGGRYPKNFWAANGYVVYVLQPSGATGFGQEFSSRHVNDWGIRAGSEIIEGTEKFLAAHSFVDPKRVGCIGASYGGFMTMYLVTQTDMFAGAVSHAGISALSSYWGEGDWGALYSAVATADKYPWNAKEFYINQGALYNADKIHTPLLMLHGGSDNNVPPGESEQLFTALKVLQREVEYIRIAGEAHWILNYKKRDLWSRTIVAFFDRTLKGDARWWAHLYDEGADGS